MRVKPIIASEVVPVFSKYDFTFTSDRGSYDFENADGSRWICFDTDPYLPKRLRVSYTVKGNNGFAIELSDFNPEFLYVEGSDYKTQDELRVYIKNIVEASVNVIFPYLDVMESNPIHPPKELYSRLSIEPKKRAKKFAQDYGLTIIPDKSMLEKLDDIMASIKPNDLSSRKEAYWANIETILGMSAYFGALVIAGAKPRKCAHWGWWEEYVSKFKDSSYDITQYNPFLIIFDQGVEDPLNRVTHIWSFYPELFGYQLSRYILKH